MSTTSPEQLNALRVEAPRTLLIDVRTPEEFQEVHATGAINIPLDGFRGEDVIASHRAHSEEPVYLICQLGGRSQKACDALTAAGFPNAINVTGGTDAWVAAGLPIEYAEPPEAQTKPRDSGG